MPLTPEEPQIHESVPGPRTAPAAGRSASTPRPVPGPPRQAAPRPAPPKETAGAGVGPGRPGPSRSAAKPGSAIPSGKSAHPGAPKSRPADRKAAQIQLIPAPADGAVDAADETVDLLLDTGRAPGEILVLTTGDAHPWAAHELSFGEASYWAQYDASDDVFYADISAPRATGRPVVVVALNDGGDEGTSSALAGALERAGALLIVCGDPTRINAVLGASA